MSKISTFKKEQKQRLKIPTIPSIIELVAIGGGKGGTCRSLIVNMTHFKYMFNCGEGTQRIATEHKMLKHTKNIFITSGSWNNIGGLMGLCLTLDSADVKCLQVYGPPKVENYVTSSRNFSKLNGLELVKNEISNAAYEDSAMNIKFVALNKNIQNESIKKRKLDFSDIETSIVYICQPHKKPRSISLELCAKYDVPIGPHLQLLKEGKEITLPGTEKLIKPDDVLLPDEPTHPFIVLDCPTVEYIDDMITNEELLKYLNKDSSSNDENFTPSVVVHFTPPNVMRDPRYLNWIQLFGSKVDHLVLNDDSDDLDSEAVHRYQAMLHLIHPNIFPLLYRQTDLVLNNNNSFQNITYMKTNMKYQIRPFASDKINSTLCLKLNFEEEKRKKYRLRL